MSAERGKAMGIPRVAVTGAILRAMSSLKARPPQCYERQAICTFKNENQYSVMSRG